MASSATSDLRALKNDPFNLLRELERRSKAALAGATGDAVNVDEWVGIGFRLASESFIVSRNHIREVLMVPTLITRVPGAKPWIRGLANVRGHLLTIIDMKAFLGAPRYSGQRDARVLVAKYGELSFGLIVDEVFGFRRFLEKEWSDQVEQTLLRCEPYVAGCYERGGERWPVFSIELLDRSDDFQRAAA